MRALILIVLFVGVALSLIAFNPAQTPAPSCPHCNILLIVVDTLSAKHIRAYGGDRDTMPKTTAFFEEQGVVFSEVYSTAPWTLPSISSLLFSDFPHNITYQNLESADRPNMVNLFKNSGYQTHAIIDSEPIFILDALYRPFNPDEVSTAPTPIESAVETLEHLRAQQKPYFLMIHDFSVHDPYQPHQPYDEYFEKTTEFPVITMRHIQEANATPHATTTEVFKLRYDQGIAQMDDRIASVLDSLSEDDLAHTIIVVTADHGEAFGEHGLLGHGLTLHEEELRVPLFLYVPGVQPAIVSKPISLLDIAPTLATLVGFEVPSQFVGINMFESFENRPLYFMNGMPYYAAEIGKGGKFQTTLEELGAAHSPRPIITPDSYGVRLGDWKLFYSQSARSNPYALRVKEHDPDGIGLYNIAKDPHEKNDLSATPERAPTELLKTFIEFGASVIGTL